jgi:hypothetical protein
MDVEAALALAATAAASVVGSASGAAGGVDAAGASGQSAWESLLSLVRRLGGRRRDGELGEGELVAVDAADSEQVRMLTVWLGEQARADEEFAALLRGWAERCAPALRAERPEARDTVSAPTWESGQGEVDLRVP